VTDSARRSAGEAWAFRALVEQEAALRFDRLAAAIREFDTSSLVPELMMRAADDERRHTQLCADLARSLGASLSLDQATVPEIAPRHLDERRAALYEVVAAACITETESMATLATLLDAAAEPAVREVLHAIAKDEVVHSRMGWAHLSREAENGDVAFLSDLVPVMLAGTVDEGLFGPPPSDEDPDGLLRLGVLPHARKREVFVGTLSTVVLPGLERFGVDARPARAWLSQRTAG
jgi:rubrerythrin